MGQSRRNSTPAGPFAILHGGGEFRSRLRCFQNVPLLDAAPRRTENGERRTGNGELRTASSMFDKFHEECGVFGILDHEDAANLVYLGLYALQHRGQESAGIASISTDPRHSEANIGRAGGTDGTGERFIAAGRAADPRRERDGLRRRHLHAGAPGAAPRGHGDRARPLLDRRRIAPLQRAADRRLDAQGADRGRAQRKPRQRRRAAPRARAGRRDLQHDERHRGASCTWSRDRRRRTWSSRCSTPSRASAAPTRSSFSRRARSSPPATRTASARSSSAGSTPSSCVSSETCAFDLIEAETIREIEPGEVLVIEDGRGLTNSVRVLREPSTEREARCVFEHVYFARPDSVVFGQNVGRGAQAVRREAGATSIRSTPTRRPRSRFRRLRGARVRAATPASRSSTASCATTTSAARSSSRSSRSATSASK